MKIDFKRRLYAYLGSALFIVFLITTFYAVIYYRYPLQRENVVNNFWFALIFASICFWVVFAFFANAIIVKGEKRERQGLPFFENKITFMKIVSTCFFLIVLFVGYFWFDLKDIDLQFKGEFSVMRNASYIKKSEHWGKYSSSKRWYYTFVNEKDTLVLQTSYEYPNISTLPKKTKNLTVKYLPNTQKLITIEME